MKKVLKDLFYGNLPLSERSMPKGSAMHGLSVKLCKYEDALEALLDEAGKEQLKALSDAQMDLESMIAEENFIIGFRLGVQLMAECLTGEDS